MPGVRSSELFLLVAVLNSVIEVLLQVILIVLHDLVVNDLLLLLSFLL